MADLNKREFIALPLDHCYLDRKRYDKLNADLPTEIVSFRKYDNGLTRVLFSTKEILKGKEEEERNHLLWIQLIDIKNKQYVKYRCDCKYFEYRQLRPAKSFLESKELANDLVYILEPKLFAVNKKLFNIDKHAFIALTELFKINIQISI